jgi:hypothetical protein
MTKLMLETLRTQSSKHKNMLNENEEFSTPTPAIGDEGIADESMESDFEGEMDNVEREYFNKNKNDFREKVDKGAKFNSFAIDKETQNVSFGGSLDNGMEWSYSKDGGVELGTPVGSRFISFKKEDLAILNTLVNYYDIWKGEWQDNFHSDSMLKP